MVRRQGRGQHRWTAGGAGRARTGLEWSRSPRAGEEAIPAKQRQSGLRLVPREALAQGELVSLVATAPALAQPWAGRAGSLA